MKAIRDSDEEVIQRIANTLRACVKQEDKLTSLEMLTMSAELSVVLQNIWQLSKEAPFIQPRIRPLSPDERREFYPERYK